LNKEKPLYDESKWFRKWDNKEFIKCVNKQLNGFNFRKFNWNKSCWYIIDNGKRGKIALSANNRPLRITSDIIKGKHGRFRQNLLGKQITPLRSVIVVGPSLKLIIVVYHMKA
jgi:nucleosome binding factor SPN SPT16 subunit